ncbi:hypothetical protein COB72_09010 [bacterium]|nr:MAG: hypothetical protein COB72_09010 [bacterium]
MEDATKTTQEDEPACMGDLMNSPSVTVAPAWVNWHSALQNKHESSAREALGLDVDRPIVMSGHQPIMFHNGILAKLIALDEAAKRADAQAVWIVPDQDSVDSGSVRVPVGMRESLHDELVELLTSGTVQSGVSVGSIGAIEIDSPSHESLKPVVEWLDQYAGMETLAQQFAYATIEHACEVLGIESPRLIFASELFEADALYEIIKTMRDDPALCAQIYNNAVAKHSDAGVRALVIDDGKIELPLWGCKFDEARVAIDTTNIDSFAKDELLPRGLLMTGLVRAYLADLFIHGTGGYVYDQISEDWFRDWLGVELQPMAMVTATQHLELGFSADETVDIYDAKWAMHHVRHTPAMVGDHETQQRKDDLVAQIELLKPKDAQRDVLYRALQALLIEYRDAHRVEIKAFAERADQAMRLARQYELARDRTWAFVFFGNDALQSLDRATRAAMS